MKVVKKKIFLLKSALKEGSLLHSLLFTFSSKSFVILLSFVLTPVFARLFLPEAYGHMSIFSRISSFFLIISSFGYTDALLVAKDDKEFSHLYLISFVLVVLTSLCYLVFGERLVLFYSNVDYPFAYIFITWLGILFVSLNNLNAKISIHNNEFKFGATTTIAFTSINRITGLTIGYLLSGYKYGLILAEIFGRGFTLIMYRTRYNFLTVQRLSGFKSSAAIRYLLKYKTYPMHYLPSKLLNSLFYIFVIYIISKDFGIGELGHYAMASSLISLPVNLLGNSLSPVLIRNAKNLNDFERFRLTSKIYNYFLIILIPVLVVGSFLDTILTIFLGSQWQISAEVSSIMVVSLLPVLISTALGGMIVLRKAEKRLLFIESLKLLSLIIIFYKYEYDFLTFITIISIVELFGSTFKISLATGGRINSLKSVAIIVVSVLYLYFIL